jgi:hypothetical protein
MTRDASDWDPLPVEETGLHPGEAQAKLRKPEHAPIEASVQGFAVVRTSAPGSAVATTRSAPTVRARMDQPIPSKPIVDAAVAPSQSFAQADLLTALQRSRQETPLTQVPALPMLRGAGGHAIVTPTKFQWAEIPVGFLYTAQFASES